MKQNATMNRYKIQGFIESHSYNHAPLNEILKVTFVIICIFGIAVPLIAIYIGRSIYIYIFASINIIASCVSIYGCKKKYILLLGANCFLMICEGITIIFMTLLIVKNWLPKEYHLIVVLLYFVNVIILSYLKVNRTNKLIKSGNYVRGYQDSIPNESMIANMGLRATGIGGPLALLLKGNTETNAVIITICLFCIMYLMLELVVELFMVHYYQKHINEYKYNNVYQVHKRGTIHRN